MMSAEGFFFLCTARSGSGICPVTCASGCGGVGGLICGEMGLEGAEGAGDRGSLGGVGSSATTSQQRTLIHNPTRQVDAQDTDDEEACSRVSCKMGRAGIVFESLVGLVEIAIEVCERTT